MNGFISENGVTRGNYNVEIHDATQLLLIVVHVFVRFVVEYEYFALNTFVPSNMMNNALVVASSAHPDMLRLKE